MNAIVRPKPQHGPVMMRPWWTLVLTAALLATACGSDRTADFGAPPAGSYSVEDHQLALGDVRVSVFGATVAADFFRAVHARPFIGRFFSEAEYASGSAQVVVLSHDLWVERFAKSPHVIGRTILVDGGPATIIGVASPGFGMPQDARLWLRRRAGGTG